MDLSSTSQAQFMLQRLGPAFSQFQPKRTAGDSPFLAEKKVFYDSAGSGQTPIPRDAAVDVADAGKPPTAAAVKREKQAQASTSHAAEAKSAKRPIDIKPESVRSPSEGAKGLLAGEISSSIRKSATMNVTLFLPNRKRIRIQLSSAVLVSEALRLIINHCQTANLELPSARPEHYDLRLHEADGYPDEDFPALDRNRSLQHFGHGGVHEYCLCLNISEADLALKPQDGRKLQVSLPEYGAQTEISITDETMTVRTALEVLQRRYRLPLYRHKFELSISKADAARLKLSDTVLPPNLQFGDIEVDCVVLQRKTYADTPPTMKLRLRTATKAANPTSTVESTTVTTAGFSGTPSSTGGVMYNVLTAAEFQEWEITKVNKRGKRQTRIMGIDFTKITNRKSDRKRMLQIDTRRAERLISDILRLEIPDKNGTEFSITFREGAERVLIRYEASNAEERREICGKLEYILSLDDNADRIVRPQ